MERKECNECKENKELFDFHLDRGKPRSNCKDCHNAKKKENYNNKKEFYKQKFKTYDSSLEAKQKRKKREAERIKNDPIYKMQKTYRGRLQKAITGWCRSKRTEEILGCSWGELKTHLENQFQEDMSWDNHSYTGWHVDHIIPLSSANSLEELEKLSHYTNLQPLWAADNMIKGAKR
jgi:hypothetical protein